MKAHFYILKMFLNFEFFRGHFSRCYRIAENIVVYTSIHTMGDASLLEYVDVTYVGHKYEDACSSRRKREAS